MKLLLTAMALTAAMMVSTAVAQCPAQAEKKAACKCESCGCTADAKKADCKCDKCACGKAAACPASNAAGAAKKSCCAK